MRAESISFEENFEQAPFDGDRALETESGVVFFVSEHHGLSHIYTSYSIEKPLRRQMSVNLPEDVYAQLRELAHATGDSMSLIASRWVIERAELEEEDVGE